MTERDTAQRETANASVGSDDTPTSTERQGLKLALEIGPLGAFFLTYYQAGIFYATGVFMVVTTIALIASRMIFGKIAIMPLVTAGVVLVFGGLTLFLQDATFIKMKPTITNTLFGTTLLGCLLFNILVWKILFQDVFKLDDLGWRKLQFRWGAFFLCLAVINEIVWRNYSEEFWVNFKVFGLMPLTIIFSLSLVPVLMKHSLENDEPQQT